MKKRFKNWTAPVMIHGIPTQYSWLPLYPEGIQLGDRSDIGAYTLLQAKYGIIIGEEAQIGSHCAIYSHNTIDDTRGRVVIGKGAKIGSHSTILPGVTIGEGAVIGAHSLVKSDIPAHSKAWGVPARVQKRVQGFTGKEGCRRGGDGPDWERDLLRAS